jgi:hypothetical protein
LTYTLCVQPVVKTKRSGKSQTRRLPPTLNARIHWAERKWWKDRFKEQVFVLCKEQRIPALGKARIEMVNYTTRPLDRDNLYSSFKNLGDSIVDAGVIPDDSEEYLDLKCRNVRVKTRAEEAVVITIQPWDDA